MKKNPAWTRDELILALDLYFAAGRKQLPSTNQRVKSLSELLNRLQVHITFEKRETFRNPSGVSMKLGNFLSLDPVYSGSGMKNVSKLDREVWDEFAHNQRNLPQIADRIRKANELLESDSESDILISDEEEFEEGRLITRLHSKRERNSSAVKRKKDRILKNTGALKCEACDFDFEETYGFLGEGFAECHHKVPLSEIASVTKTLLSDLAIVCSNCHRMLHRSRPTLSIAELREMLKINDNFA